MNQTSKNLVLPREQSTVLYWFSHIWFVTAFYGVYNGHLTHGLIPFSIGLTSLNYWRNPYYDWKRQLDISMCTFGSFYTTYHLFYSNHFIIYLIIKSFGLLSYWMGCNSHKNCDLWKCTYYHMGIHVAAHMGCYLLYETAS
jgi:hypothetical protein